jgi:hypothetical protein
MNATVKYNIATYSGHITVNCDENDEDEFVIGKAKQQRRNRVGTLPLGYESWKVIQLS